MDLKLQYSDVDNVGDGLIVTDHFKIIQIEKQIISLIASYWCAQYNKVYAYVARERTSECQL